MDAQTALHDLYAIMDTLEFEQDGLLVSTRVERVENDVALTFTLTTGEEDAPPQQWQIVCHDVRAHRLELRTFYDLRIENEHVLLWPHLMAHTSVSFYGHVDDPFPIIGALYQRHVELVGTWIPFERYFNHEVPLAKLLCGTAGMLAEGPEQLVLAYEAVLQQRGLPTAHRVPRLPTRWNPEIWTHVEEQGPLSALLLDDLFVVASSFTVTRVA